MWSTSVFFICALVSYSENKLLSTPIWWSFSSIFSSFQDENIEEKLHEIGVDSDLFFQYDTKAQIKKTKVDHIY